jgi:hypothetical protein
MEIDIKDYLSQDEIKVICADHVRAMLVKGGERIVSNLAYECAYAIIDSTLPADAKEIIREKVAKIVSDPKSYDVFRPSDIWMSSPSLGHDFLMEAIRENAPMIREKVRTSIESHDYTRMLRDDEPGLLVEGIIAALRKGLS